MIRARKNARCQRLVFIDLWQHAAWSFRGVKDLDSDGARDVVTADFVDSHAVAEGGRDVRWGFVEFEFAFGIDWQTHWHLGHFGVEDSFSVDSKGPGA